MRRLVGTIASIIGSFQSPGARKMNSIGIRAVLFQQDEVWCAQCLEHDIAAEAPTLDALKDEMEAVLAIQAELSLSHGKEPFADLPRAPEKYFRMYEALQRASGRIAEEHSIPLDDHVHACIVARFAYQHDHVV
ncbi:hypothetical protein BJ122_10445 [Rhodopseudomonas faecalis]|uniref:DUF1902 domain-containing protein n=2 Tax=Rhodopseudomonas faecalis TaxID=99655 RepID=A0A318TJP3_9BRAD|nr:hypothetical protein BJ122_10445 [Rhodopseudomonas faecalis]